MIKWGFKTINTFELLYSLNINIADIVLFLLHQSTKFLITLRIHKSYAIPSLHCLAIQFNYWFITSVCRMLANIHLLSIPSLLDVWELGENCLVLRQLALFHTFFRFFLFSSKSEHCILLHWKLTAFIWRGRYRS